ncbi:unnamed protein product [Auanema sp. JU1783]|nr:unnamed protein product [Auanema sp. JU1783]
MTDSSFDDIIDTYTGFEHLYHTYDEYNADMKEINYERKNNFQYDHDVKHLSDAVFPTPAFPVEGMLYGHRNRQMVPLVFQNERDPTSKILNVWCVVDTNAAFTCLSVKTLEAFVGEGNVNPRGYYRFFVQEPDLVVECMVSKVGSAFEHADILGMDALARLKASPIINWSSYTFRLQRFES